MKGTRVVVTVPGERGRLEPMTRRIRVAQAVLAAVLALLPARALAQSGGADPFAGSWRLDVSKSTAAWQAHPQPKRAEPAPQTHGLITMKVDNGTMEYRVEHAASGGPPQRASYSASYNDARWRSVQGTPDGPFSEVTLVRIHDRLHYWVTRQGGQFAGLALRRLAEDGRTLTSVGIGADGRVQYVRVYVRQ
jgi:hypothetical protein